MARKSKPATSLRVRRVPRISWRVSEYKKRSARIGVVIIGGAIVLFLFKGWWQQTHASLACEAAFGPLAQSNGYIQVNVLGPHPVEQYFNAELFLYYKESEWLPRRTPESIHIEREASGGYGTSLMDTPLVPFSEGRATPTPLAFDIPTPGASLKKFPLDSRTFDFSVSLSPAQRPKVVVIRNQSTDFIPECGTLSSRWDGLNKLSISVKFRRNPFVQTTAIIFGLAALLFGILLVRLRSTEDLIRAIASYFFSLWSVRALITPSGLGYSTALDIWLMLVALLVLFLVLWRLTKASNGLSRSLST